MESGKPATSQEIEESKIISGLNQEIKRRSGLLHSSLQEHHKPFFSTL
jgi:hypothetical protein